VKTAHLFTGQLEMGLGGIYHYGARFYSVKLGRFLSADTVVPNFATPQSLNRYAYGLNNPLTYVDPSGHVPCANGEQCLDGRVYDDCWVNGEVRNIFCNNFNWVLNVNDTPVLASEDTVFIVGQPQIQPQLGLFASLQTQGQNGEEEDKEGNSAGSSAGGGAPGGGGDGDKLRKFLQDIADRAANRYQKLIDDSVSSKTAGIKAHKYAEDLIARYQRRYNEFMEISTERSYTNGDIAQYRGEPGSVRLDVVVGDLGNPRVVYDFKFGGAKLTNSRITQIRDTTNFSSDTIIRPIFGRPGLRLQ
jgi:RHS repeat-associated protein